MRKPIAIRTPLINRRTFILALIKLGVLILLFIRLFYMQFIKRDKYKILSEKNRISLIIKPPIRGKIVDANNKEIATNKQCYQLLLDKNIRANYIEEVLLLQKILKLDDEELSELLKRVKQSPSKIPLVLFDQLSWEDVAAIEEYKPYLTSISIEKGAHRFYPYSPFALAHILGYLGKEQRQQAEDEVFIGKQEFNMGKTGIEKYYEKLLQGGIGYKQIEVNAYGQYVRTLSEYESVPGNKLQLTLDSDLQTAAYKYLNKQGASAVVMDVYTGEIMVLASSPYFDPNQFNKLSPKYWKELTNDPYKPLINKVTSSSYPPGSVFKLITILAALDSGMPVNKTVRCTGASMLGGTHFKCHSSRGHGDINMFNAIKYSCNSYMYEMARRAGGERLINTAAKFGFGQPSGIDLPSEIGGFLPTKQWKKTRHKSDWTLADSMNLSIGQGFLSTTPIQLVRYMAGLASGKLLTPKLSKIHDGSITDIDIPSEHFAIVREGMNRAVNTPGGTAYYSRIPDSRKQMAGKTGTSQVQSKSKANENFSSAAVQWHRRNHAVFGGFAPFNDPRYAIVVFVDHGGAGGRAAAPIASKIMNMVLNKHLGIHEESYDDEVET